MRLVATSKIEPGTALARDVHSGFHHELPLVRAGVVLEEQHRLSLARAGIDAVYVEDEFGDGIEVEPLLSDETRAMAMSSLVRTFAETSERLTEGGPLPRSPPLELAGAVKHIRDALAQADHPVVALPALAPADGYTLQHSVDVTALGLLVARRHFRDYGRPAALGRRSYEDIEAHLT